MNCEVFQTEMHTWRNQSDASCFEALFRHMAVCPNCCDVFRTMTGADEAIRQTVQTIPQARFLEQRILAGLEHERTRVKSKRRLWMPWVLAPVFAFIVGVVLISGLPRLQQYRLRHELAVLLSQPPDSQLVSTNREQLLDWSSAVLHGSAQLPPELGRVQFRGATAVEVAHHQAVLLKMKNEHRASLLVVDGALTKQRGFNMIAEGSGNASLWSDGHRTYVLLFKGSRGEMQGYMERMGISTWHES